ncbi:MAG: Trk system potassium transporter TrkA [Rhodoferax sp.]|nr:Trk system potassium transporter TrkA [Rhodoferax sp.]MBP9930767.1 Trk system potassium transporter TrkA [Rhodoferax sp.]HQZ04400.1 Trk system potassium transporter TrkA [Burkholderiaceae bacterium]HRA62889.1 Trk system potassium transporter TrkA [Burkholderiaceae bacterium]
MRLIILGAGRVGESVAESLASEQNDITVIDPDPDLLRKLEDRLDLRGVVGDGVQPSVLRRAGAEDADLFIACASLDETNLAACKVARSVFGIQTTIARLRSAEFAEGDPLLGPEGFGVDHVICPEESLMHYINQLIAYPQALQVLEFSQGRAHLIAVRAAAGSALVNHSIGEFKKLFPEAPLRVVAIYRQDHELPIEATTQVLPGDEVFVLADKDRIRPVLQAIHGNDTPVRSVMIAGGGKVGMRLARSLSGQCQVKIIEANRKRCEYLAGELPGDIMVLQGDSTDEDLLIEENVGGTDLFIALTSDDEDNILSAMLAKRLGARRVMSLINRRIYAEMMQGSAIDIALSPAQTVIGELLVHVRRGDVAAVHSLRRGTAEAIEGIARGDKRTSRLVGHRIDAIELPTGARFGAVVRGQSPACEVLMPLHDLVLVEGDHVIIYVPNKRQLRAVEKMFQVSATFF